MESYEAQLLLAADKNLETIKYGALAKAIDKISEFNKWATKKTNQILI
jgi:hypothetical protein